MQYIQMLVSFVIQQWQLHQNFLYSKCYSVSAQSITITVLNPYIVTFNKHAPLRCSKAPRYLSSSQLFDVFHCLLAKQCAYNYRPVRSP